MTYTPHSPSRRQPETEWYLNEADVIERQLQASGHLTWGYVIYRTTYASETDWAEFLHRLRYRMTETLEIYNGRDMLDRFTLTVFSDRTLFDGADTPAIRAHFRHWAQDAVRDEQQRRPGDGEGGGVGEGESPRYRFCVQVDAAALRSVVHDAPAPPAIDLTKKGWVRLVSKLWVPREEDPRARPEGDGDGYEAVEGVRERDVGWMKCPYQSVMTEYYSGNEGLNGWRGEYCRPPAVAGPPYDDE